jgi:hypothetical protein
MTAMLPTEFADLERFSEWCLPSEPERFAKRLASSMAEMQAFYDAITSRAEEAISYCDKFPLEDMPEDVLNLMHLLYRDHGSFRRVLAPRVPDSGAAALLCPNRCHDRRDRPARRALGRCRYRRGAFASRGGG